jgi:hypothetical protein
MVVLRRGGFWQFFDVEEIAVDHWYSLKMGLEHL